MFILIFITVGSRRYPFDRLFKELDKIVERNNISEDIFAQIGTSKYKPKNYKYKEYLSPKEFSEKMTKAEIIISHGASGTIVRALKSKKKVIAVTRLSKYGEHIDDHQIQLNKAFEAENYLTAVYEIDDLDEVLMSMLKNELEFKFWENNNDQSVIQILDEFIIDNWK